MGYNKKNIKIIKKKTKKEEKISLFVIESGKINLIK